MFVNTKLPFGNLLTYLQEYKKKYEQGCEDYN